MNRQTEELMELTAEIHKQQKGFELNICFSAKPGCLGILGPSGCGKTMTLQSIAGIVTPDEGQIRLRDRQREQIFYDSCQKINVRPQKRNVGYLFQNYALFPNMTVAQNIEAGLKHRKKETQERENGKGSRISRQKRVEELACRFGLEELLKRYPRQLSGGQQQRVALARILAYEPRVLLMDEPFSAMDSFQKEGLRLELKEILKDYKGVSILVTHDRDEAFQLCDRLLLLNRGTVLTEGWTKDVFDDPATIEAARLIGCKNISRIERLGGCRVRALDWNGLELVAKRPPGPDITAVGIRAHDFQPLSPDDAKIKKSEGDGNVIPVGCPRIWEMPSEWYVTLENGLCWKKEKNIRIQAAAGMIPQWLWIPPDAILLLKEADRKG